MARVAHFQDSDEQLLLWIQEGSHPAFAALVKRHAERFHRVAFRFTGTRESAEDIVQEAFIKLWENPNGWRAGGEAKFTTWFYRIIVNRCVDAARKTSALPLDEEIPLADDAPIQDEIVADREEQKALEREINKLPERQRTALNLCFGQGLSNSEAAEIMGVKIKALESLLMRAKTELKERLKGKERSWQPRKIA